MIYIKFLWNCPLSFAMLHTFLLTAYDLHVNGLLASSLVRKLCGQCDDSTALSDLLENCL